MRFKKIHDIKIRTKGKLFFFLAITLFCLNPLWDAEAMESVKTGKEVVKILRDQRPNTSINTKAFQKPLNQEVAEWTRELEGRLEKDSKEQKKEEVLDLKATEEQKRIAEDLISQSANITNEALEIKSNNAEVSKYENTDFYIFASFAMGEKNLENLIKSASKYNAIVVMRGFKEGDIRTTAAFLSKFIEKTGGGITIDPELFKEYEIRRVPSFVLTRGCSSVGLESCKKEFDILRGNVSPRFALEKFSAGGDLADEARGRLKG